MHTSETGVNLLTSGIVFVVPCGCACGKSLSYSMQAFKKCNLLLSLFATLIYPFVFNDGWLHIHCMTR